MPKPNSRLGKVIIADREYAYGLRRSLKAKRISIRLSVEGIIEVVVPRWASYAAGEAALRRHREWLAHMLQVQQTRQKEMPRHQLRNGDFLPFFGRSLLLHIRLESRRRRAHISLRNEILVATIGPAHNLRQVLRAWYRRQALQYFTIRARSFEAVLHQSVTAIRIMEAATRWGSCNSRARSLSFNWRLALAPEAVAAYVTAHEMAHLVEANHSKKFWEIVKKLDNTALESRRWLKRYGHTLSW